MILFPMYYASQGGRLDRNPSGKFLRVSRAHDAPVGPETYGDWQIRIVRSQVGVTVKRAQYSAIIRRTELGFHEYLPNFRTVAAARQTAREKIDAIEERLRQSERQIAVHGSHGRRRTNRRS